MILGLGNTIPSDSVRQGLGGGGGGFNNTYSLAFDGVDDYVDCGDSDNLSFGNGSTDSPFSISAWIKPSSTGTTFHILNKENNTTTGDEYVLYITSANILRFAICDQNFIANRQGRITSALTASEIGNVWCHIVATYDGRGGSTASDGINIYVNGVNRTSGTFNAGSYTAMHNTTSNVKIGSYSSGVFANGNIDETAIFSSELTSANVTSIYNSGVPNDLTSLNPTAWYRNGDNGSYKSPQWLIPNNSNKDKVSNYSFEFDGVDDYVDFGNPTSLQITTDLSVSFWFKGSSTADQAIVAKDTLGLRCWGIWNNVFGAGNNLQFYIFNSNSLTEVQTSANYNDGNWHNVVCVFKPSTYLRIYVDGVLDGENTTSIPATIDNDAANLTVGAILSSGSPIYEFEGNVDEVAIWNSDQSANVASIYNSGTPTTLPSGAVARWKMGEEANFTDNWLVNNSALSNYSTRSFNFDGVDDYMTVSTPTTLTDFTTSVWLHRTGNGNFDGIFGQDNTTAKGGILRYVSLDGTNITLFLTSGWTAMSGALAINTWHHFALTYDSTANELKSYINGSLYTTISSPDFSGQNTNAHSFSRIGMRNGNTTTSFPGLLDEIALWNTAKSASDITAIYNGAEPTTITGAIAHWRMGENATFSTNWSIPDQVGSSTVASVNMTIADLEGEAPNYTGGGLSANMTIEDRVGEAPNSTSNALSYNMTESDRETDVPT